MIDYSNNKWEYSYSILVINTTGNLFRLFSPFKVIEIATGKIHWVDKIYFDSLGLPHYLINNTFMGHTLFKIIYPK